MRRIAPLAIACLASLAALVPFAHAGEAGLIVRHGDGDVDQMCVAFDGDETTGADLLEWSGIDYVEEEGSLGTAICSIEGQGCGRDDCFCRYPTFWGYWTKDDDEQEWRFSDTGASDRIVRTGTLDGWSFGRDGKPAPPDATFDEICSAAPVSGTRAEPLRARPNYIPFLVLIGVLAAAGIALTRIRRGRSGPS